MHRRGGPDKLVLVWEDGRTEIKHLPPPRGRLSKAMFASIPRRERRAVVVCEQQHHRLGVVRRDGVLVLVGDAMPSWLWTPAGWQGLLYDAATRQLRAMGGSCTTVPVSCPGCGWARCEARHEDVPPRKSREAVIARRV
jgi:hypothetical protein